MEIALILNGEPFARQIKEKVIMCVDGGYNLLPKKYTADYLIGDMDSINCKVDNINTTVFPSRKNQSDGELAIYKAKELGAKFIAIYGATGGREDHIFGNYSLLKLASTMGIDAKICTDNCDILYKNHSFTLKTEPKEIVSIISFGSDCLIESAKGLSYPLNNLLLTNTYAGRGISNEALSNQIEVLITHGEVLVFHYMSIVDYLHKSL